MSDKKSRILLGVILIALAVFFLLRGVEQSFTPVIIISAGLVLLLLFWTKRKSWSLVAGMYLTLFGINSVVSPLLPGKLSGSLFIALFYIAPAGVFFTLYYLKNKRSLLLPSMIFFWFGVFTFLSEFEGITSVISSPALLLVCSGLALTMTYTLGRTHIGRWALTMGIAFTFAGILFGTGVFSQIMTIGFAVLVVIGLLLIASAIRRK